MGVFAEMSKTIHVSINSVEITVRKSRGYQTIRKFRGFRNLDLRSVKPCSPILPGFEDLISTHFIDNSCNDLIIFHETNADSIRMKTMEKICGAIKGVDNPAVFQSDLPGCAFFSNKSGFRKQFTKFFHKHFLRTFVNITDEVVQTFLFGPVYIESLRFFKDKISSFMGSFFNFRTDIFKIHR